MTFQQDITRQALARKGTGIDRRVDTLTAKGETGAQCPLHQASNDSSSIGRDSMLEDFKLGSLVLIDQAIVGDATSHSMSPPGHHLN
jgi:hypothetical protein